MFAAFTHDLRGQDACVLLDGVGEEEFTQAWNGRYGEGSRVTKRGYGDSWAVVGGRVGISEGVYDLDIFQDGSCNAGLYP